MDLHLYAGGVTNINAETGMKLFQILNDASSFYSNRHESTFCAQSYHYFDKGIATGEKVATPLSSLSSHGCLCILKERKLWPSIIAYVHKKRDI